MWNDAIVIAARGIDTRAAERSAAAAKRQIRRAGRPLPLRHLRAPRSRHHAPSRRAAAIRAAILAAVDAQVAGGGCAHFRDIAQALPDYPSATLRDHVQYLHRSGQLLRHGAGRGDSTTHYTLSSPGAQP
jgi:hypothetical protein